MQRTHDMVVIGAGSGGYAAARTAKDFHCNVALVDPGPLGGLCILRGCMPSKALIATSDAIDDVRHASQLGIQVNRPVADMPFVARRKRALVKEFADYRIGGIEDFPLYSGAARFLSETELAVGEDVLRARKFVVATGSVITPPELPGLSEIGFVNSDGVLDLEEIPKSAIVLGGGYTACELGQFLSRMGAETTMIIRSGHLLTETDDDIGEALTGYFREEGIRVFEHASLSRAFVRDGKKVIAFSVNGEQREIAAEQIFYALGRKPMVEGLQLERAGVRFDPKRGIEVNEHLRTSNPNIYAVGDVTGRYMLVHVAIYQGEVASRHACTGDDERADYRLVSAHTVFTDPQVAVAGATEKELRAKNVPYVVGRYDFAEHGKAQCLGKTKGFVKMMADPASCRMLGAAVIGPQGSELIHETIVAMEFGATVTQFMRIPHLHPTLAEIWTYPAEICASQVGLRRPGDEQIEIATSVTGAG